MTNVRAILGGTIWMVMSLVLMSAAFEPVQTRPAHAAIDRPVTLA